MRHPRIQTAIILVFLAFFVPSAVLAQKLTVQGDRFAIDGTPKFIVFWSYFSALGAQHVPADFKYLKSKGFDGVRIWPNFVPRDIQLMRVDGTLNPEGLSRLLYVLDRARDEKLVVDVSFTAEHVPGLDATRFGEAILATTAALKGYDNLLFDIENERNVYGPFGRPLSGNDVANIRAAIKSIHPDRIVTASNSSQNDAQFAADFAAQYGLDVTAYHDPRTSQFYQPTHVKALVDAMRSNGRPAYFQEPMPTRYAFYPNSYRSDLYREAMLNMKLYGAAAWCFHSDMGEDISDNLTQNMIEAFPEPEGNFVNALIPRINLRSSNGTNYVVAEGGGGADVNANRVGAGSWETFRLIVLSGGPVISGDRIALQAVDGHYLQAVGGGGAGLRATGTQIGAFETFTIEKTDGGAIREGDTVRIRANTWYLTAEGGGGGGLAANRASAGAWETFTVHFVQ